MYTKLSIFGRCHWVLDHCAGQAIFNAFQTSEPQDMLKLRKFDHAPFLGNLSMCPEDFKARTPLRKILRVLVLHKFKLGWRHLSIKSLCPVWLSLKTIKLLLLIYTCIECQIYNRNNNEPLQNVIASLEKGWTQVQVPSFAHALYKICPFL